LEPHLTPEIIAELTTIVFGPAGVPVAPCDVIFVFGGSHPGLWETAAEAYWQGLGNPVIVTGGHKPGVQYPDEWKHGDTPEAHVLRRELMRLGVPEGHILSEDRSTNTLENVLFAKEVFDFSTVNRVLAVCKCYGVGRQCRTLEWNIPAHIQVVPYPFDTNIKGQGPVITRHNWMEYETSRAFVLAQVGKIVRYGKMGHLRPLEEVSPELRALIQTNDNEFPNKPT
jgi:hypothetical protein